MLKRLSRFALWEVSGPCEMAIIWLAWIAIMAICLLTLATVILEPLG